MRNLRYLHAAFLALSLLTALAAQPALATDFETAQRTHSNYWKTDKAKFLDNAAVWEYLTLLLAQDGKPEEKPEKAKEVVDVIVQIVLAELTSNNGVNIETALTALGGLAGFSVQMAIREGPVVDGRIDLEAAFLKVETNDGSVYFTGRHINEGLVSPKAGQLAVWSFVADGAIKLGAQVPDILPIFKRTTTNLGTDNFATPALPQKHLPLKPAEWLVNKFWNVVRNQLFISQIDPMQWPYLLAMAAREVMIRGKLTIDAGMAARIVMEAAIPMSRIHPDKIHNALLPRPERLNKKPAE